MARGIFGSKVTYATKSYDALRRRRCAGDRHRVARVPRAGFPRDAKADAHAGDLRRPQHLSTATDEGARASPTTRSDGSQWRGSSSPAGRATSAVTPSARCSTTATPSSCSTICRRATPKRCPPGVPLVRAAHSRPRGGGRCAAPASHRRRHAFRRVAVGRRLGARSARLLPEQRRRLAGAARRRWSTPACKRSCFRRPARSTASLPTVPIVETLEKRPINAYGETKLAVERALAHVERAHGLRWIALRYFNAAGAHPDGTIGEDHAPEIHLIPRAIEAATGGRAAAGLRRRTIRRRTAPACATTFTCATWPMRTCWRCDALDRGAPSGAFNAGTGQPHSVKQVIDDGQPRGRLASALDAGAAPSRRSGDALCRERSAAARAGLAAADTPISDAIVQRRLALAPDPIRTGIGHSAIAPDGPVPPPAALRGPAPHAHRRRDAGDAGVRRRVGGAGVADQADHRRRPADAARRCSLSPSAIVVAYFFKGVGGYFSSYLMDDLGHRVVMRLRNDLFRHLLDQSAAFFARRTTGALLSRINNDVGQVHRAVAETRRRPRARIAGAGRLCRAARSTTTPGWRCCA